MDLSNLASILKPLSGVLGGILAGPVGATAAPLVVGALASALGLSDDATPEQVAVELNSNPLAPAIVAEVEQRIGKTAQEIEAAVLETVNQTARLELQSESKFVKYARPFNIWIIGIVTGGYGACLIAATGAAVFWKDSTSLSLLVANAGVLGIALAPNAAVAGVSAWGRTREKLEGVSTALPTLTKVAASVIKKAIR
jgi:hypothetical protein